MRSVCIWAAIGLASAILGGCSSGFENSSVPECQVSVDGTVCNAAAREVAAEHPAPKIWPVAPPIVQPSEHTQTAADYNIEQNDSNSDTQSEIALHSDGGTLVVPVSINGALTLDFVIDSGAADVTLPADVVLTLVRTGTLRTSDFIGSATYILADGSRMPSPTFIIRTLKVGGHILRNVRASATGAGGSLLLGQSFLGRFRSWSIDNRNKRLILG